MGETLPLNAWERRSSRECRGLSLAGEAVLLDDVETPSFLRGNISMSVQGHGYSTRLTCYKALRLLSEVGLFLYALCVFVWRFRGCIQPGNQVALVADYKKVKSKQLDEG